MTSFPKEDATFQFKNPPRSVLLVKKPDSMVATSFLIAASRYLVEEKKLHVFVEPDVLSQEIPNQKKTLKSWKKGSGGEKLSLYIDFIVTIGGDGTILHAASLFPNHCPPILALNFGSLGFLSPFSPKEFRPVIEEILSGNPMKICNRQRIMCKIVNKHEQQIHQAVAMNEIAITSGSSSLCTTEVSMNGQFVTRIDANGVLIATATGSSAYSLSAGGALMHSTVEGMQLTPIAAHSLTSRPIILPKDVHLQIKVPDYSRYGAIVSVDGKADVPLDTGDFVEVTAAPHPCQCFSRVSSLGDWIESLSECLSWNADRKNRGERRGYERAKL